MTKEEIIAAAKECAAKLGHAPSATEFAKETTVGKKDIRKTFGSYSRLLFASGLERQGCGYLVTMESLFLDWAATARSLGKVPTMSDYELQGKYSVRPLTRRYNGWKAVAAGMREHIIEQGLESQWKDVLDIIAADIGRKRSPRGRLGRRGSGCPIRRCCMIARYTGCRCLRRSVLRPLMSRECSLCLAAWRMSLGFVLPSPDGLSGCGSNASNRAEQVPESEL